MESKNFEFPQMMVLSHSASASGNSPEDGYHRTFYGCCYMD